MLAHKATQIIMNTSVLHDTPHHLHVHPLSHLGHKYDEHAGECRGNDHEHSKPICSVSEEVNSQHQSQRCSYADQNHHDVHGNANKTGVVDVIIFDVATLVGQKQATHHQQAFVDVQGTNQVDKVITLAFFMDSLNVS